MKTVKIIGGLGNQMFQYSFYCWLNRVYGNVKIDISEFGNYYQHNGLELENVFNTGIHAVIAEERDLAQIKDLKPLFKVRRKLGQLLFRNPNLFIKNTHFCAPLYCGYYPSLIEDDADRYYDGYWQNEKYFELIDIRSIFRWSNLSSKTIACAKKMSNENSVSLHIRRLDSARNFRHLLYLTRLRIVWRVASKEYYVRAIQEMKKRVENPVFYIFTDNILWVDQNIHFTENMIVVDWNRGNESNQDMYLMSRCRHNIISMSSFSWWGAWLNASSDKIVISPRKWASRFVKCMDIIPSTWIKI
ncbi:MAG: alpha-1,2-fucosyltransferase [Prevotellaceae bacterium]|jgi:hypothetical protein|nr:alpha-1,2-fucosyltransferase [Prevotellaceae bacterium]